MKPYNWVDITILLVESDQINRNLFEVVLRDTRCKILLASTGIEAINYCKSNEIIDLVLLEILVPDMNGYDLIEKIKKIRSDTPIIVQTSCAMNNEKEKCFQKGCDYYLSKPLNINSLLDAIHSWVS